MSEAQRLRRLGELCVAVGALAWLWGFAAAQEPSSAWHVRGAPSAVDALASRAWITGLACYVVGARVTGVDRVLRVTAYLGAALALGAHVATAWTGWLGVQLMDMRAGARAILAARVLGGLFQGVALVRALRRSQAE